MGSLPQLPAGTQRPDGRAGPTALTGTNGTNGNDGAGQERALLGASGQPGATGPRGPKGDTGAGLTGATISCKRAKVRRKRCACAARTALASRGYNPAAPASPPSDNVQPDKGTLHAPPHAGRDVCRSDGPARRCHHGVGRARQPPAAAVVVQHGQAGHREGQARLRLAAGWAAPEAPHVRRRGVRVPREQAAREGDREPVLHRERQDATAYSRRRRRPPRSSRGCRWAA